MSYDAVIVGGGHNGLVAGFYLARAGAADADPRAPRHRRAAPATRRSSLPVSARPRARTSFDAAASAIWRDMRPRAARHPRRRGRSDAQPVPRRRALHARRRYGPTLEETRRFSRRDARRSVPGSRRTSPGSPGRDPVVRLDAARPARSRARAISAASRGRAASRSGTARDLLDLAFLFTTSATQFLAERFESEHVMAALGWHAINDSVAGRRRRGPRSCCSTTTRARTPAAARGSGGSSAAAWAG